MSSMICKSCACGCLILPYKCLYERQGRLQKLNAEQYPELFDAVNGFILIGDEYDALFGIDCFNALCEDIKQAQEKANEYCEDNVDANGPESEFWFYLSDEWKAVLENGNFQKMYAAYCVYYYYYLGIASSETSEIGDYEHNLQNSNLNDGDGGKNITLDTSNRKAQKQLAVAKQYANIFKRTFWNERKHQYGCRQKKCSQAYEDYKKDCKCGKHSCQTCNPYQETPRIRKPRTTWL